MKNLINALESVILEPGDLIIDELTGFVGVLICRERRIDMFEDDIYFWLVRWIKNIDRDGEPPDNNVLASHVEEEGLKLSIIVEMISHYSANGGTHEF